MKSPSPCSVKLRLLWKFFHDNYHLSFANLTANIKVLSMSEATMRSNLVKTLKPLDALAIESPSTGLGIPDVNFIGGWIECKWLRTWPKGCDTRPVRFGHPLTKEQQVWLWRRETRGGLALVAAQVSRSWFFWSGKHIKENKLWDNMTRPQMIKEAVFYSPNGLEKQRLRDFLSGNDF